MNRERRTMKSELEGDETSVLRTYPFDAPVSLLASLFNLSKQTINRPATGYQPTLNRHDACSRLLPAIPARSRLPAIFARARAGATPTATDRNELHLLALTCGYLHPVAVNTIFSAEPQQLQLSACRLCRSLYRSLYRKLRPRFMADATC